MLNIMKSDKAFIIILIIAPFIYLFPHTFALIEMGNDFELLYYSYKKYIFEFIQIGHLPLWSPSEGLGQSLVFNPFAQYFYPLSWILYFISYLIGDLSKHTYLMYTIFGLSIYNVGQYFWLKKLNIDIRYCFFATLITCFGLKLNEILRFPNAIHTFAWFSWILYGMTLSIKVENKFKSSLILFISTLLILTAGYPYYILYALILFTFYFLFISFTDVKKVIYRNCNFQNNINLFLNNSIPPILALLIVIPWFSGIKEVMEITHDRNIQEIYFSHILSSGLIDQLGSWILPPIAIAEGYYYFGSIITLLLISYGINLSINSNKNPIEKYFLILFIIFFIFNYQFAAAKNSYLFEIIWNKVDFIKNFRAFSRINILLIPLFSVLICFSLKNFIEKKYNVDFFKVLIIITLSIVFLQLYIIDFSNIENIYWETWQQKRLLHASQNLKLFSYIFKSYNNYLYPIFFILSFITLFLIKKFHLEKVATKIIVILVVSELFVLCNIQWAIPYKYYDTNNYNSVSKNPLKDLKDSFFGERIIKEVKGNTFFRYSRKFNINYVDQLGMNNHSKLIDKYFKRNGEYKINLDKEIIKKINFFWGLENNNDKIFFTKKIDHLSVENFVDDVYMVKEKNKVIITIDRKAYNGDEIVINLNSDIIGYLTFVDNWSPGWKVYVNNQERQVDKVLNAYKSIKVNAGSHKIKFKYDPW